MLKSLHARRTLALFTQGRAIHRDPSRRTGLAPRIIAEEAGVTAQEVVRCRDNRPISSDTAEKMAVWNEIDLTRAIGADPERVVTLQKTATAGSSTVTEHPNGPVINNGQQRAQTVSEFSSLFREGFRP